MDKFDLKDIEIDELPATSSVLMGAAHHLGNYCKKDFTTFVQKRFETKDPRMTVEEGKQVTQCALGFFRKLRKHCDKEFTEYWGCLDYNNHHYGYCRKTQSKYDACVLENFGLKTTQPVHISGAD